MYKEAKTDNLQFDTLEWSLKPDGGSEIVSLLDKEGVDPLSQADLSSSAAMII